jgi:hypothetical protein
MQENTCLDCGRVLVPITLDTPVKVVVREKKKNKFGWKYGVDWKNTKIWKNRSVS